MSSNFLSEEHTASNPKYPDVEVQLTGTDGNAFAIIGAVTTAMKRAGCPKEEVDEFQSMMTNSDSYDDLLRNAMRTVMVD